MFVCVCLFVVLLRELCGGEIDDCIGFRSDDLEMAFSNIARFHGQ